MKRPTSAEPMVLSVVVASFRAREVLDACLAALVPQCGAGVELIVARTDTPAALDALAAAYPTVRLVPVDVPADVTSIPWLRGAGLAVATGQIVALTEDHCVPSADWVAAFRAHLGRPAVVIGGRMDNARPKRAIDWGAFFAEYGFFAAEEAGGLITGANVAYARAVVGDVAAWMCDGAWENVVHDRLRAAGAAFAFEPRAVVGQNLTYAFGAFVVDRYRHGRDYARTRLVEEPGANRWARVAATPLLPPLLTWRVGRAAARSSSRVRAFVRALPFTFTFLGAWSAGELVGYLHGPNR